jgi:Protein of unknown function (DUF3995)
MKWLLSALLGGIGLLYLYWALGGRWLADKASPIVQGSPLIELTWHRRLGAACASFILAAVPVVRMLFLLREFLLLTIMAAFAVRALGDFKYTGFLKSNKDSVFAFWDTNVYSPLAAVISILAGYLAVSGWLFKNN